MSVLIIIKTVDEYDDYAVTLFSLKFVFALQYFYVTQVVMTHKNVLKLWNTEKKKLCTKIIIAIVFLLI